MPNQTKKFHFINLLYFSALSPIYIIQNLCLIAPYFIPLSQKLKEWASQPFESTPKHPEQLIHKTASGKMVRSKSEVLIDMVLHTNRIPFRYESPLQFDHIIFYPDFTIRHPKTGQVFYWEHFGMADEPEYCRKMSSKLARYASHGIIPTINLITTYETIDLPLSLETYNQCN